VECRGRFLAPLTKTRDQCVWHKNYLTTVLAPLDIVLTVDHQNTYFNLVGTYF